MDRLTLPMIAVTIWFPTVLSLCYFGLVPPRHWWLMMISPLPLLAWMERRITRGRPDEADRKLGKEVIHAMVVFMLAAVGLRYGRRG